MDTGSSHAHTLLCPRHLYVETNRLSPQSKTTEREHNLGWQTGEQAEGDAPTHTMWRLTGQWGA